MNLPARLREDVLRRARTNFKSDPQKDGFCPRCTNKILSSAQNFCTVCGAGLVSAEKAEKAGLNSDDGEVEVSSASELRAESHVAFEAPALPTWLVET